MRILHAVQACKPSSTPAVVVVTRREALLLGMGALVATLHVKPAAAEEKLTMAQRWVAVGSILAHR
jgi:hypothetical protein